MPAKVRIFGKQGWVYPDFGTIFVLPTPTMTEHLVLTVFPHPKWGSLLKPARVEASATGELAVLETDQASFADFPGLNQAALDILRLTAAYADKALMKSYSKEKTTTAFLATVTGETVDAYIRPFIERCHHKIVRLLPASGLAVYERKDLKTRVLWPVDRLHWGGGLSSVAFTFERDEAGLRYYLRIEGDDGLMDLYGATLTVLCQDPAVVVVNRVLHAFESIDVKKLRPFLSKRVVEVPLASEKAYVKTFVRNCLLHHVVNTVGLDVKPMTPVKKAILALENGLDGYPALVVTLCYEGKKYPLDHTRQKMVVVDETADKVALRWFQPDRAWEQRCVGLLTGNGLMQVGPNHFVLPGSDNKAMADTTHNVIDWLRAHPGVLAAFTVEQRLDKQYFLGEVTVELAVDSKQDWFDVQALAVFGAYRIPLIRFRHHILENIRDYVLPDGTLAVLPEEWFVRYRDLMVFGKEKGEGLALRKTQYKLAQAMDAKVLVPESGQALGPVAPSTLKATLRPYQVLGFQWLVWLCRQGFGGILADDMGLGKTVQVIALLAYIEQTDPAATSLIVVPTSLVYNWQQELRKCAPHLKVQVYSGSNRLKTKDIAAVFKHSHVVLTTYGVLRNDIEWLEHVRFHHLVLDESQFVKNPDALIYKAVERIQAAYRLALTGTPVENSLMDLWAQFNLLNEQMLGSRSAFRNTYQDPIAKENKEREAALLRLIQPFLLRRTKQEVTPELPLLLEETVYCDMSPEQEVVYKKEKNQLRNSLLDDKTWEQSGQASFLTLQGLTRLRLLANYNTP